MVFRRLVPALCGLLVAVAAWTLEGQDGADAMPIRRYGLFIGANNGGPDRTKLLYAESDCRAMLRVLEEVGGVAPQDAVVLVDPDPSQIVGELGAIGSRIGRERSQARRVEFVLYYSGHSDDEALMLGRSRLLYADLRECLRGLGADISIAILDSCASGAFIRMKGGQRKAPFLVDESSAVQGQVYLTSSSEDEASQESDALGGSFFTNALISALRGAADVSLDGKVTLHEAYQYASQETLARTENTQAGPQHPSWYINLNGTGDLVLTDLRSTTAGLVVSEEVAGRIYIRDEQGKLVAEVRKSAGTPLTLALPPGSYGIGIYTEDRSLEARVVLKDGKWAALARTDFRDAPRVATRSRGGDEGSAESGEDADAARARELVQAEMDSEMDSEMDAGMSAGDEEAGTQQLLGQIGKDVAELGRRVGERVRQKVEEALKRIPSSKEQSDEAAADETDWTRAGEARATTSGGVPTVLVSVGIVPGLSFPYSGDARKVLSLNLLMGMSYSIAGLEASPIINFTSQDVSGVQAAGIGNIVNGNLAGLQSGGVFNMLQGRAVGLQSAGVFNVARKGGGLLQASGVFNMVESPMSGAQVSGVFNRSPGINGAQIAGVFNMADGRAAGVQVGGVFNYAVEAWGFQSAVANVATDLRGVQVGVVNVAKAAKGVQIGVVNVSSSLRGLPIGLVNIVGDGLILFSVGWDDRNFATFEFASGKTLYTVLAMGAKLTQSSTPAAVSGMVGIGLHLPVGPFFLEAEMGARNVYGVPPEGTFVGTDAIPFPTARARAGILLFNRIGAYVGYAVDGLIGLPWVTANTIAHTGKSFSTTIGDVPVSVFPRFTAGVSIGRQ